LERRTTSSSSDSLGGAHELHARNLAHRKPRKNRHRWSPARSPKETQIIAIYGKGGIGKSFTLANLSYMMAQQGKKVLLIGCDPKSDTTSLLFGGRACPTIIETSSTQETGGRGRQRSAMCASSATACYAMELGGPEVGRGCGGRGIIHGFETARKTGLPRLGL